MAGVDDGWCGYSPRREGSLILLTLTLLGCNGPDDPAPGATEPPTEDCTDLSWENFGQGAVRTYCTPCHSTELTGDARSGAPDGMDFDTWDGISQWLGAIEGAATGEDARMPPAGGVSAEERADLLEWLSCGAPGGDSTAPDPCDAAVDVDTVDCETQDAARSTGDLVADGRDLSCVCEVTGDLRIEGDAALAALHTVGGDVLAESSSATGMSLPSLVTVGGQLSVDGAPLDEVELSNLESVGGRLSVIDTTALAELDLDHVATIGAGLEVAGNAALVRVDLARLVTVGGDLGVRENPALVQLANPNALLDVAGDVHLIDNDSLLRLDDFHLIVAVGGEIRIEDNDVLASAFGFQSLTEVGGPIVVRNNASLIELGLFQDLVDAPFGLEICDHPELRYIETFPFLATVGLQGESAAGTDALRLCELPLLTGLHAYALLELTEVGALELRALPELMSLDGLGALERVEGDLTLEDLDRLDSLPELAALIEVGGVLRYDDLDGLESLPRAPLLTTVGGLEVVHNDRIQTSGALSPLRQIDGDLRLDGNAVLRHVDGLSGIGPVAGQLVVRDHPALATISGLYSVDSVGGDVVVIGNVTLPAAAAEALVTQVGAENIGGSIDISDNGP